ncbi:uncharacterized protein LAESUDRAFT_750725, partial [Laetiporus sulphureus 93-53]
MRIAAHKCLPMTRLALWWYQSRLGSSPGSPSIGVVDLLNAPIVDWRHRRPHVIMSHQAPRICQRRQVRFASACFDRSSRCTAHAPPPSSHLYSAFNISFYNRRAASFPQLTSSPMSSMPLATRVMVLRSAEEKSPRLSVELTDMIIDELRDDMSTLRNTCIVHKVTDVRHPCAFFELLSRSEHLGLYVRELRIILPELDTLGQREIVQSIPLRCKCVQKLELRGAWISFTEKDFRQLDAVKELTLVIEHSNIDVLQSALRAYQGLESLTVNALEGSIEDRIIFDSPDLTLISSSSHGLTGILSSLAYHPLPSLESLAAAISTECDLEALCAFLRIHGKDISSLDLRFPRCIFSVHRSASSLADVIAKGCLNFHRVSISSPVHLWFKELVPVLGRTAVQEFVFDFDGAGFWISPTDKIFGSEAPFSAATSVTMNLYVRPADTMFIGFYLPEFRREWSRLHSSQVLFINVFPEDETER